MLSYERRHLPDILGYFKQEPDGGGVPSQIPPDALLLESDLGPGFDALLLESSPPAGFDVLLLESSS